MTLSTIPRSEARKTPLDRGKISAREWLELEARGFLAGRVALESDRVVLWIGRVGAVISGDTSVDFGRLEINDWLRGCVALGRCLGTSPEIDYTPGR
jgi:hypothetical protein